MTSRDHQLIQEIEEGALDEGTPIASVLRKCLALGGRAGSTELRDWARQELNGYKGVEGLPPYRTVPAAIQLDAVLGYNRVTGQTIGPHQLPEVAQGKIKEAAPLFWGVAEIEDMARRADDGRNVTKIVLPSASVLVSLMNSEMEEFEQITALYWAVSRSALRGVLDQIRTTCTELVAELRASLPDQTKPTREAVDHALHVAITGERNVVQVVNTHASSGGNSTPYVGSSPPPAPDSWWQRWRKRGIIVGVATVVAAVVGVATWLGWKPPWP